MEESSNKVLRSDPNKIDALPDSILYNILSFLDMKEVIATSLVSRRWRYLWESVSVLNFEHEERANENDEVGRKRFMNFVDRVLLFRDGSKLNRFKISCACDDADRLGTWLTVAARKQFQEVHLDLYPDTEIELPDIIFSSAITVFSLVVEASETECSVKIPGSVSSSPQLKMLILSYVELPEGNSKGELIFSCPVLENLTLQFCDQTHLSALIISTPQLKRLVIENSEPRDFDPCHTKIWALNLVSLEWNCLWDNCYSFGNLSKLVNAKIVSHGGVHPNAHNLIKVLDAVSCATTIELFLQLGKPMPNELISKFSNIRRLTLRSKWPDKLCFSLVLKLLKNAPSIETLVLKTDKIEDFDEEVSPFMLCHLKSVEIGKLKGHQNEVNFLRALLKIAIVLEELIIEMTKERFIPVIVTFGKKIRSLPRASASITVLLHD